MKKIVLPDSLKNLGSALTDEEMRAIPIGKSAEGKCTCTLYLKDGTTSEAGPTTTYTEASCDYYCQQQCESVLNCYKHTYSWDSDGEDEGGGNGSNEDSGSGSEKGSGSGSNPDKPLGSGSGSGGDSDGTTEPDPEKYCLCWDQCTYRVSCTHRKKRYQCKNCYCRKRCTYYKSNTIQIG